MRVWALTLLVITVAATASIAACGDDGTSDVSGAGDSGSPDIDSSTTTTPNDASGGDGSSTTDGSPDAPNPGTAATVLVMRRGSPEKDVTVIFHDATGAVVDTKTTGADGKASRDVSPDSQISVLLGGEIPGRPTQREILTFVGVKPGDELTAIDIDPSRPNAHVLMPGSPPVDTTWVDIVAGHPLCGSVNNPPNVLAVDQTVRAECANGNVFPVIAIAKNNILQTLGASFKKSNVVTDVDAGATVTGFSPWAAMGSFAVSVTNAPAISVYGDLQQIADGVGYARLLTQTISAGAGTVSLSVFPGYADALQSEAIVVRSLGGAGTNVDGIAKREVATQVAASFDLAQLLPHLTGATIDATTPERPSVTWTSESPYTGIIDGIAVRLEWGQLGERRSWSFVLPPNAAMAKAPMMPAAAAAWLPPVGAPLTPFVEVFESDLVTTYDEVRAQQQAFFLKTNPAIAINGRLALPLPKNGSLKIATFFTP